MRNVKFLLNKLVQLVPTKRSLFLPTQRTSYLLTRPFLQTWGTADLPKEDTSRFLVFTEAIKTKLRNTASRLHYFTGTSKERLHHQLMMDCDELWLNDEKMSINMYTQTVAITELYYSWRLLIISWVNSEHSAFPPKSPVTCYKWTDKTSHQLIKLLFCVYMYKYIKYLLLY